MLKRLFIFTTILFTSCKLVEKKQNFLIRDFNETDYSSGYKNIEGDTLIEFGKYPIIYTDTFRIIAIVGVKNDGIIGINRKEEKLFNVHVFDNWPDEISEGFFRIFIDKKYGFANMVGIQIKPKFEFVLAFSEGFAAVNIGGHSTDDYLEEHKIIKSGKWGFIDKKGHLVIECKFDSILQSFKNGKAQVELDNEIYYINTKGEKIQP